MELLTVYGKNDTASPSAYSLKISTVPQIPYAPFGWMGIPLVSVIDEWITPIGTKGVVSRIFTPSLHNPESPFVKKRFSNTLSNSN